MPEIFIYSNFGFEASHKSWSGEEVKEWKKYGFKLWVVNGLKVIKL